MANWNNYPGDGQPRTYMDIDSGDITVVTDNGVGYSSVFRIKNKK